MPGPRPTPTAILKTRGSWRAKQRSQEPQLETEIPPPPAWLSKEAEQHWHELAAGLHDAGILANIDQLALGLLVDALCQYLEAKAALEKTDLVSATDRCGLKTNPLVRIRDTAWERVLKGCREFGLTASSRSGVHVIPPKPADSHRDSILRI